MAKRIKTKGLLFEMKQNIKKNYANQTTRKMYIKHARWFTEFYQSKGITAKQVRDNPIEYIQMYINELTANGKSASTIHTYISFLRLFFQLDKVKFNKPARINSQNIRGRDNRKNLQGQREEKDPKYAPLVDFQRIVGIRRDELARLKGCNFKQDDDGFWCVEVEKGKGGKYQLQRIPDENVDFIRKYFDGSNEKVFPPEIIDNNIDLHSMRAQNAQKLYLYYSELFKDEAVREEYISQMVGRYKKYSKCYLKSPDYKKQKQLKKFLKNCRGTYKLRGNNVTFALEHNMPVVYDKTAVMAVSVFHLSHWRCDVTVSNYILAKDKDSV